MSAALRDLQSAEVDGSADQFVQMTAKLRSSNGAGAFTPQQHDWVPPSAAWLEQNMLGRSQHKQYKGSQLDAKEKADRLIGKLAAKYVRRSSPDWKSIERGGVITSHNIRSKHVVRDGQGCGVWRFKVEMGAAVPRQFSPGSVGQNSEYSRSANRELIRALQDEPAPFCNSAPAPQQSRVHVLNAGELVQLPAFRVPQLPFVEDMTLSNGEVPHWVSLLAESVGAWERCWQ